jgi:hypothetical protein
MHPKELGRLGIPDPKNLNWALRLRWQWLRKIDPTKPWASLPFQANAELEAFFLNGCSYGDGDGTTTLFWKDRWLSGKAIKDIGPLISAMILARIANKRTVCEALADFRWVYDVHGTVTVQVILEFMSLCEFLEEVPLQPGVLDKHIWRLSNSGFYSAKSAYTALFQGSILFGSWECIWKTWAPNKCRFFLWLVAHNRCWTVNRLARHNLPHPDRCPFYDQDKETIHHLLATCMFARQFWSSLLQHTRLSGLSPQPSESTFDDWWMRVLSSVHITLQGGLSSLFILGEWTLWRHRNDCVFNGVAPRVSVALSMVREEALAWCMAGAKDLSVLTATDLVAGS